MPARPFHYYFDYLRLSQHSDFYSHDIKVSGQRAYLFGNDFWRQGVYFVDSHSILRRYRG